MENYSGGRNGYWKRRSYNRLSGESRHRHGRRTRIELGGDGNRKKFWRVKVPLRLKLLSRIRFSPKRVFTRIRDAYLRMMVGFASSGVISNRFGSGYEPLNGFPRPKPIKEYDEKMIIRIYQSLLAHRHLVSGGGGGLVSGGSSSGPVAVRESSHIRP